MRALWDTVRCLFVIALLVQPAAAQDDVDQIQSLARECATEIPWGFDLSKSTATANAQGKPVLVYVRMVDSTPGYESATQSVAASDVSLGDDGYRKDLLFRACVLADRNVQSLIRDDFVPVCMTYHFQTHGRVGGILDWTFSDKAIGTGLTIDPDEGAKALGSIRFNQHVSRAGSFMQTLKRPAIEKGTYRLSASIKTQELNGRAFVKILWYDEEPRPKWEETKPPGQEGDWSRVRLDFEFPAKPRHVLVMPTVFGHGTAWFDDLELRRIQDGKSVGPNLLRNGEVDPNIAGDPLIPLGDKANATITPALLVVRDGKVVRKLHRIGAMSPDYVTRWLQSSLKDADRQPKAKKNENSKLLEATAFLRKGEWSDALGVLAKLRTEDGSPEGQFLEGLCLHRLGRHAAARARWSQAVGHTRWGRRSAACLLSGGPHPVLSLSERAWANPDASVSTEHPESFDGKLALRILLEMQAADGSFVSHRGRINNGRTVDYWQPAYTGIAVQAIAAWKDNDPERQAKTEAALHRSRKFLVEWSKRKPGGSLGAFNYPYAIHGLLTLGENEAVERVVNNVVNQQAADGTWSVYGPVRPTSFNTAQAIVALVAAREAGITVPPTAIDKGCAALEKMRAKNNLFPYAPNPGFGWMTTEFGSIARDPLCEHALLAANKGDTKKLAEAMKRFLRFHEELRKPTKHLSGDFNPRGHGSYFLFYALHNAIEAAAHVEDADLRAKVIAEVQAGMLEAAEKDSSAIDHAMYGRAYGTGMALLIFAAQK